jgi:phosphoribosylformylglycinamidine synthase
MNAPEVCILNAPGINCNEEMAHSFALAGANPQQVHINELISGERSLEDFKIFGLAGGFSYGDEVRSGAILGLQLRTQLREQVESFLGGGGLVMGVCNGFQVLVESGLLPDGRLLDSGKDRRFSLAHNSSGNFECRWADLRASVSTAAACVSDDMRGTFLSLPVAHGEGRFLARDPGDYERLLRSGQVILSYCDESGQPTMRHPANPNGSPFAIAGVCDPTGNISGMMPHPEAYFLEEHHPNFRRMKEPLPPQGLPFFKALVQRAVES